YGNIHGYIVCIIETTAELVKLKTSYSCATEIANYIYIENEQKLINKVLCQHNAVIECMDDGFICWNSHSLITMVNSQAQTLLNIDKESLIGQNIRKGFVFPPILNEAITQRNKLSQ
ncbi:PAS domain-containing protein, partial [Escherichia coli]